MTRRPCILIVDDDPNLQTILCDILRLKGYAPHSAADGQAALAASEELEPVVALIDLTLPDADGLDVMEGVAEHSPATQCIVLTGHASQASAIEAVNRGAYSYLEKPYDLEQLLLTVRRAIEKRETLEKLRQSERKYRHLFELGSDALSLIEGETGRVLDLNNRAVELYGYSREEALRMGRSLGSI